MARLTSCRFATRKTNPTGEYKTRIALAEQAAGPTPPDCETTYGYCGTIARVLKLSDDGRNALIQGALLAHLMGG
jgi:hypothetical protein